MSNIDKRALREAADLFCSEEGDHWWDEKQLTHEDGLGLNEAEGKFIATAKPATVLALLDELEAVAKQNARDFQIKARLCRESNSLHDRLREAEKRISELEVVKELFLRAKALMYQSGGTPIENSLNPIDAWLYDAERAAAAGKGE